MTLTYLHDSGKIVTMKTSCIQFSPNLLLRGEEAIASLYLSPRTTGTNEEVPPPPYSSRKLTGSIGKLQNNHSYIYIILILSTLNKMNVIRNNQLSPNLSTYYTKFISISLLVISSQSIWVLL